MILSEGRDAVISNIKSAAESGEYHAKVELGDPTLSNTERDAVLEKYADGVNGLWYGMNNWIARKITDTYSAYTNRTTQIEGLEKVAGLEGGAIVTSNHFSPEDNTVVRKFIKKAGKKRLYIVSQDTNFAMNGFIGYLMNYTDTIPLSLQPHYMLTFFEPNLKSLLDKGNYVLIYPEQEMWFRYRKPRPAQRGAYYYAAKFNVPIVPCFVEIRDRRKLETPEFHRLNYVLHVLDPIYLDPTKTIRQNSYDMKEQDYLAKKAAYEKAYGKPLKEGFEADDIAGWVGAEEPEQEAVG